MGLDFLECLIDVFILGHLLLHLDSHEVVPQLVNVKVASHFVGILILTFIGGTLSDLLISLLPIDSALHRLFLVGNTFLQLKDSAPSIFLLLLDILHQLIESVFRLESLFLGSSLLGLFNGKDLTKSINPDEVVAYGGAVQAANLTDDK